MPNSGTPQSVERDKGDQTAAVAEGDGASPAGTDLTGRTLGDFQVLRKLGQGGMGQVYLAEQLSLKRKVALKILRPDLAANPTALKRFKQEAEAVARLTHANIVQVYQSSEHDGIPFMALEYVEGRNLREYIARKGTPETLFALSILRKIASALQRASEFGIIHRDIKPENILLTRKGEVKVADFGLSRVVHPDQQPVNLTQSGVTMGTPLYMAPEQVQGKAIDARTDIYSFGVTAYHMLAGEPPYKGASPFDVALQHVQGTPTSLQTIRPDLPVELCAVVHKMMARDPEQRYPNCRELLKDLARIRELLGAGNPAAQTQLPSLPSSGPMPTASPNPSGGTGLSNPSAATLAATTGVMPAPRSVLLVIVGVLAVLLAAVGGGLLAWQMRPAVGPPPDGATRPEDADAVEALFSLQKREKFLEQAVRQYANPSDANEIQLGMGHCVELGVFYLEQWRIDDADHFFADLDRPGRVPSYRILGKLGIAIVRGLQNQPVESNTLFLELLTQRSPLALPERLQLIGFLNRNPKLRKWIAIALDYNAANASVPRELEEYRKATPVVRPTWVPPGGRP